MNIIDFNYNWNNKLNNTAFTTIRLRNDKKYVINNKFYIDLHTGKNKVSKGIATIIDIKHFTINKLNNYIAFLDTGYNSTEATRIIQTMYKNKIPPINWDTQELSLILLVKDSEPKK